MELRLVRQRRAPGPLLILAEVVPFAERLLDYAAGDDRCLNPSRHRSRPSSRFQVAKMRLTTIPCHYPHDTTRAWHLDAGFCRMTQSYTWKKC